MSVYEILCRSAMNGTPLNDVQKNHTTWALRTATAERGMKAIRAGFGRESIVPDFPVELSGFAFRRGTAKGTYDEIHVTAVVFDDGSLCLALVVAELLAIDRKLIEEIKKKLLQEATLRPENVLICCTHTHSAPGTIDISGAGRVNPRYLALLAERVVRAVQKARDSLSPCQAFYGEVRQRDLGVNRRLKTKDGITLGLNEKGPRDDLVRVLSFRSPEGVLLGGISNFGCHPYLMTARPEHEYLISGDFPHWAVTELESSLGGTFLHMNGAGADVSPRPIPESSHPAKEGGKRYAKLIKAAVEISKPVSISPMRGILGNAKIPLQDIPSRRYWVEVLERSQKELATLPYDDEKWSSTYAKVRQAERAIRWLESGKTNTMDSLVQVIRLGDLCIVGLEHEVCIEVGEAVTKEVLKAISKGRPASIRILIASQANGCLGYIPTDRIIEEGGYEVDAYFWYGQPAPFASGAGNALVSKIRELILPRSDVPSASAGTNAFQSHWQTGAYLTT